MHSSIVDRIYLPGRIDPLTDGEYLGMEDVMGIYLSLSGGQAGLGEVAEITKYCRMRVSNNEDCV